MEIKSVMHPDFIKYGQILEGYDFTQLLATLCQISEKPASGILYVASEAQLERLPVVSELEEHFYGGQPMEMGYCNGSNSVLNCLEYHRGAELNITADDVVLLLAPKQAIVDFQIDSDQVEAFLVPKGTGIALYETTLHYAPCSAAPNQAFRVAVALPRGTNYPKHGFERKTKEDALLMAQNKWLIAHPDSAEAKQGAYVGIRGKNLYVFDA